MLAIALQHVQSESLSINKASTQFGIVCSPIFNKFKGKHTKTSCGQKQLSDNFEAQIVTAIDVLTEWKIPLCGFDICHIVKSYLDSRGIFGTCFKENFPRIDWLSLFVKRHNLTQRLSGNVSSSRAEITNDTINK